MITDVIVKDAGDKGLSVFAKRDFSVGEFIFRRRGVSTNCAGYVILSYFALSDEQERRYLPYGPKFIQEEYHRHESCTHPKTSTSQSIA